MANRSYNDGLSDLWHGSQNSVQSDSGLGGNLQPQNRPTSSYVFSRPQQQQQQQQPQQQQQQATNTPLQNLLQNLGSNPSANPGAMALAQLLLAAQPNGGFQGNRDLQMRVMQNNLANAANRRVEGLQGGLGRNLQQVGSLGNLSGMSGGSQGSGGGSMGNNSFMNLLQSSQTSAQAPAPALMPEPIAPLPMMGDLLQQRQQAVEAQQEAEQAAEPEPEEDKEEDILDKVGKISDKLKSMLGSNVADGRSESVSGCSTGSSYSLKGKSLRHACFSPLTELFTLLLVQVCGHKRRGCVLNADSALRQARQPHRGMRRCSPDPQVLPASGNQLPYDAAQERECR